MIDTLWTKVCIGGNTTQRQGGRYKFNATDIICESAKDQYKCWKKGTASRAAPNDCSLRRRFLPDPDENDAYLVVSLVNLAPEQIEIEINNGEYVVVAVLLFALRSPSR